MTRAWWAVAVVLAAVMLADLLVAALVLAGVLLVLTVVVTDRWEQPRCRHLERRRHRC